MAKLARVGNDVARAHTACIPGRRCHRRANEELARLLKPRSNTPPAGAPRRAAARGNQLALTRNPRDRPHLSWALRWQSSRLIRAWSRSAGVRAFLTRPPGRYIHLETSVRRRAVRRAEA